MSHAALRTALPELGALGHLGVGVGLAGLTTASWAASYVMPDALSAPGLLALFLGFRHESAPSVRQRKRSKI